MHRKAKNFSVLHWKGQFSLGLTIGARCTGLSTSTTAKASHKFLNFIRVAIVGLLGVWNHAGLDRCYCFPKANHYPDGCRHLPGGGSRGSARASLYSNSSCCHCLRNWDAGRSTASLHHCFMIASFREQLSSKLAVHWHHGQAPAASWFQLDASERYFVMDPTLPGLQKCFGDAFVA